MKFVMFVEGPTEKEVLGPFLGGWLNKRLSNRVGIQTVKFGGWPRMVEDMALKAHMHLNAPDASKVVAVIALLDLYGPDFYPASTSQVDERIEWATEHLQDKVRNGKFRVFFAVHEIEAWLLSQPSLFPTAARKVLPGTQPEEVNFDKPPSKRLSDIYMRELNRSYRKTTDGKNLFAKLDSDVAYEKCPYLRKMLDEMLRIAKESGL